MGLELLLQGAATAASAGMGCGTCCGSGVSAALSGYLMTHAKNFRQGAKGFLSFYLGKLTAVMLACGAASLAGAQLIDEAGYIGPVPVKAIVDGVMIAMGVYFIVRWVLEQHGKHVCGKRCSHHAAPAEPNNRVNVPALWGMGAVYGISPCAPLLLMLGYSATLPFAYAVAVGGFFAVCTAVSPALFALLLSGAASGKIYKEIPQALTWFRLGCYALVTVFFAIDLFKAV